MLKENNAPDKDWAETHFLIVLSLTNDVNNENPGLALDTCHKDGIGGLMELAYSLTNEFQELYSDVEWDGDYLDMLESFLKDK